MKNKIVYSLIVSFSIFGLIGFSQDAFALDPIIATPNSDAMALANSLNLPVSITNAQFIGSNTAAGTFSWNNPLMPDGLILSSGKVVSVNPALPGFVEPFPGTQFGLPGNSLMEPPIMPDEFGCPNSQTHDASVLIIEFDNPPDNESISLQYVYGTEDFPEDFVNDYPGFLCAIGSDKLGVFLSGGIYSNTYISRNTIGNPIASNLSTFPFNGFSTDWFLTSTFDNPTPFNAITTIRETTTFLSPNTHYTMTIIVADSADEIFDSFALIRGMLPIDSDGDGVPDVNDICPGGDDNIDTDFDGVPDACDICQGGDDNADTDFDGKPDACDNCPNDPNPLQEDIDIDGIGDSCDPENLMLLSTTIMASHTLVGNLIVPNGIFVIIPSGLFITFS